MLIEQYLKEMHVKLSSITKIRMLILIILCFYYDYFVISLSHFLFRHFFFQFFIYFQHRFTFNLFLFSTSLYFQFFLFLTSFCS